MVEIIGKDRNDAFAYMYSIYHVYVLGSFWEKHGKTQEHHIENN